MFNFGDNITVALNVTKKKMNVLFGWCDKAGEQHGIEFHLPVNLDKSPKDGTSKKSKKTALVKKGDKQ